ncbi:hypothetical protein BVRB_9g218830 [Beta vulgaris subsp. vulgaris]|uniref:F-box/LRR-repeat protein 14 n=1 Tax=Beta vulgaris subsp. vulgaris TaxID=3555 RepID=UPI00053FA612|nr:F-box/LRR-repeat protein 14 [Beta vulgaris subsp. vulgaris]KMT00584.1 hypothetical protein BVRB_9g218830 [Beta vulgaris subsp. vulgaris]
MAAETTKELPDECWVMIFNHLNHESDHESISLVCKRFLSITNSIRVSMKVFNPSIQVLYKLLQRFCSIKKLQLSGFLGDLSKAVLAITQSELHLEELDLSYNRSLETICFEQLSLKLKNLKILDCSSCLGDADLVRIANSFPRLEELVIGDSDYEYNGKRVVVTDDGIDYLSSKLKRLRKIKLSHNKYISDKSLVSLSSNCEFLEQVNVFFCGVTEHGFSFLVNNSRHLRTLLLSAHFQIESFRLKSSTSFASKLQSVSFIKVGISDKFLEAIAEAQIPLTDLSLLYCKSYTFNGLLKLLYSYQSLKTLVLRGAEFLTNEHIENLSSFLHSLTSISLSDSPELSDSAFVMLIQRCPLLCHLEMVRTSLGREEYNHDSLIKKHFALKHLDLSSNSYLNTSGLKRLLHFCPKLEKIRLYACFQRYNQLDVADILECNKGVVNLVISSCQLKLSRKDAEISMLETLNAQYSEINNEVLAMLGRISPRLVHLDLMECENLTEEGVKEVVKSCRRLRFLSLSACENVDTNIIAWIVTNRPSLRRVVSPSCSYPDEEEQKHFLQQGCLVTKGAHYEI